MNIDKEQIASKRTVGTYKGKPVIELVTKGGLHMMVGQKDGKHEAFAAGPHSAVAKHIASKREPDIVFTELSKADYMEPYLYMAIVPEYERLTDLIKDTWERM
jgi:hypothetical protein